MARPPKKGLAYFPFDVDLLDDIKVCKLIDQYGTLGLSVYVALLTMIYREGYYINLSPEEAAAKVVRTLGDRWCRKNGRSSIEFISRIILTCAEIGLFDETLVRQKVITSVGIQRRYASAMVRNKFKKDSFWLLDDDENTVVETVETVENSDFKKIQGAGALESAPVFRVSATETPIIATETPIIATEMQQIKEKKNKTKSIEGKLVKNSLPVLRRYGAYNNVYLTDDQLRALKEKYPADYHSKIDQLSSYLTKSGKYYANHFAVICDWAKEDEAKAKAQGSRCGDFDTDEFFSAALRKAERTYLSEEGENHEGQHK